MLSFLLYDTVSNNGINFKIINKTAISWYGSNRMVADMYCLSYCPTLIGQ